MILKKLPARYFDKIELTHIETNNELAVVKIENTKLDFHKSIISVDLESCSQNCPFKHAIDVAITNFYSQSDLSNSTLRHLLYTALNNLHLN